MLIQKSISLKVIHITINFSSCSVEKGEHLSLLDKVQCFDICQVLSVLMQQEVLLWVPHLFCQSK